MEQAQVLVETSKGLVQERKEPKTEITLVAKNAQENDHHVDYVGG